MRRSMLGVYLVPEKTFDPKTDSQPARKSETLARKLVRCRANVNDVVRLLDNVRARVSCMPLTENNGIHDPQTQNP